MGMTKCWSVGVLALVAVAAFGCGSDSGKAKTKCPAMVVANQQVPGCSCGDAGGVGVQTCGMDGNLTDCACGVAGGAGTTGGSGTTGSAGTSSSTAGTSGAIAGTTGTADDDGGVAGTGGSAGKGGGGGSGTSGGGGVQHPAADGTALAACDPTDMTTCGSMLSCYSASGATPVGFCTNTCTKNADCTSLGANFTCSTAQGGGGFPGGGGGGGGGMQYCRQTCTGTDDKSCPEYMSCLPVQGGFRCLYDAKDIGSADKKQWEQCSVTGDCTGDLICYSAGAFAGATAYQGFCTQKCMATSDCSETPATGDVKPDCYGAAGQCRLNCAATTPGGAQKTCPDGMKCLSFGQGPGAFQHCAYAAASSGGV